MTKLTADTIDDKQIQLLQDEAAEARDAKQVDLCRFALGITPMIAWNLTPYAARGRCADAINMTNPTNTAAIESLRTFALAHNELAFARMCAAALGDEQNPPEAWAGERVNVVLVEVTRTQRSYRDEVALNFIRSTDTTRPDGLVARSLTNA